MLRLFLRRLFRYQALGPDPARSGERVGPQLFLVIDDPSLNSLDIAWSDAPIAIVKRKRFPRKLGRQGVDGLSDILNRHVQHLG